MSSFFYRWVVIALLPALWSELVQAKVAFEAVGGGITYHVVQNSGSDLYSYKVTSDGRVINNPVYGVGLFIFDPRTKAYTSLRGFMGMNSIARPVSGGVISFGYFTRNAEFGIIGGGYVQNDNDFAALGVVPYSVGQGANAFVPVIGLEINFKLPLSDTFYLKEINVLTPIITNHSMALGVIL